MNDPSAQLGYRHMRDFIFSDPTRAAEFGKFLRERAGTAEKDPAKDWTKELHPRHRFTQKEMNSSAVQLIREEDKDETRKGGTCRTFLMKVWDQKQKTTGVGAVRIRIMGMPPKSLWGKEAAVVRHELWAEITHVDFVAGGSDSMNLVRARLNDGLGGRTKTYAFIGDPDWSQSRLFSAAKDKVWEMMQDRAKAFTPWMTEVVEMW